MHAFRLQIFVSIPACISLLEGPYIETNDEVVKAFRPGSMARQSKPGSA
jgi:molybdopterin adenylyltransferase